MELCIGVQRQYERFVEKWVRDMKYHIPNVENDTDLQFTQFLIM